jgi:RNA polymerase sigma-70 factor, ECF subfamily
MKVAASGEGAILQDQRDEAVLIASALAGDSSRFLELIAPYERSIYLLANSVLKNQADAEDAAQETVMKAYKNLQQFRAEGSFKSWLLQIAMNEARLRLRKEHGHLFESLDVSEESEEGEVMPRQFADWREIPSEGLDRLEVREQLSKALAELPDKYRQAFLLRDVQHLSEKEAAEIIGVSVANLKSRLHRARMQLRERLTPMFKKRWTDRLGFRKGEKPW